MEYKFISHEKTTVRVLEIHHQSHVRAPFKIWAWQPPKHRFLTITRSQRYVVDIKNKIFKKFFYTQIHWKWAGIDAKVRRTDLKQARQLLVILENLEATLRIIVSETEITLSKTEPSLISKSVHF